MLYNFDRYLENNHQFETDYIKVLYYDLEKNYKGIYKSYEYNRICTIIEGSKNISINNGHSFEYSTSEFILLPPNSSVEMDIKTNTKAIVYEISNKLIDDTKEHIQNKFNLELTQEAPDNIISHMLDTIHFPIQRINDFLVSKDRNKSFLIDLYAQELAYSLLKNNFVAETNSSTIHEPIQYTIQYMKSHIDCSVSIQEIAGLLNMSASNLSFKFKKATGFTPKEFYNIIKLKKSKEELKTKSVTEVCYALGFENISYFIYLFKKYYGETPKQYSMKTNS